MTTERETAAKKQEEVRQFVGREVYYCLSSLVYELTQGEYKNEKAWEDLLPVLSQEDYISAANGETTAEERKAWFEENPGAWVEGEEPDYDFTDQEDARAYCDENRIEPHIHEALEHWAVSDWLAKKLKEKGEMVIDDFCGLTIWGRCTSGQAILLDGVINEIYDDTMKR